MYILKEVTGANQKLHIKLGIIRAIDPLFVRVYIKYIYLRNIK
jgi:hypothetical protein